MKIGTPKIGEYIFFNGSPHLLILDEKCRVLRLLDGTEIQCYYLLGGIDAYCALQECLGELGLPKEEKSEKGT